MSSSQHLPVQILQKILVNRIGQAVKYVQLSHCKALCLFPNNNMLTQEVILSHMYKISNRNIGKTRDIHLKLKIKRLEQRQMPLSLIRDDMSPDQHHHSIFSLSLHMTLFG